MYSKNLRDPVISISRVIGMLSIVLCHSIRYYTFIPGAQYLGMFFNFGVPLFLFISGYLYGGKTIHFTPKWFFRRFVTVSLPAILFSCVVMLALAGFAQAPSLLSVLVYLLDLEGLAFLCPALDALPYAVPGLGPLWFTTVIMLCYGLLPLLQKLCSAGRKSISPKVILITAMLGFPVCAVLNRFFVFSYFLVFILGYLSGHIFLLDQVRTRWFYIHSLAFLIAVGGRLLLHRYADNSVFYNAYIPCSQFVISTWFLTAIACLNVVKPEYVRKAAASWWIQAFDRSSFYVYLTHAVFCTGIFNLYDKLSPLAATVPFLLAIALSSLLLRMISETLKKKLC